MSRKDYNKGMEAGAKPFEDKFRQMGSFFAGFASQLEQDYNDMKDVNDAILDEMDSMQKAKFYKNHTVVDLRELYKGDRETLLSILLTLVELEDCVTKEQQYFIRSVKRYLEESDDEERPKNYQVLNLEKEGWSIIDTIESKDETKAIVQAVMEFLFLKYQDHDVYMEEYEDMFECFNLNQKGFREIREHIDSIYKAVGLQGIAENYGYVPEEADVDQDNIYGVYGGLKEKKIVTNISIASGEEKKYENEKIILGASIQLDNNSRLSFNNCHIIMDEAALFDSWNRPIFVKSGNSASVSFINCTIEWEDLKGAFIDVYGKLKIVLRNCLLEQCTEFVQRAGNAHVSLNMEKTKMNFALSKGGLTCLQFVGCDEFSGKETIFEMPENNSHSYYNVLIRGTNENSKMSFDACTFKNLCGCDIDANSVLLNSTFENCMISTIGWYEKKSKGMFDGCDLKNCVFDKKRSPVSAQYDKMSFMNCNLSCCIGEVPSTYLEKVKANDGYLMIQSIVPVILRECEFSNWSFEKYKNATGSNGKTVLSDYNKDGHTVESADNQLTIGALGNSQIQNCVFQNLQLGQTHFIGGICHGGNASYKIADCKFVNITTDSGKILRDTYKYTEWYGLFGNKSRSRSESTLMNISNCIGL